MLPAQTLMLARAVVRKKHSIIMTTSSISYINHVKTLLLLGIPIVIGQLGAILQGLADTLMVGHYSDEALASSGFVNSIMNLVIIFALGYSYAITPKVGASYARGEKMNVGKVLRAGVEANMTMSLWVCLAMLAFYFILPHLGQPDQLIPLIRSYYLTILISLPFQILFNAFKQFFDGITHTRTPMWIMLAANVMNIVGNWLLIYGVGSFPELGLLGAGVSTLLSRIMMAAVIMVIFYTRKEYAAYHTGFSCHENRARLRKTMHDMGRPLGLQMGMETAAFNLCAVMQGWIGADAMAAHQVMTNIGASCFLVYYGIGAAVTIRSSHFCGVNDWNNVTRCAYSGYAIILTIGLLLSTTIAYYIHPLSTLFTSSTSIQTIVQALALPFFLYQLGDGLQVCFSNALRGIGDVKPLMRYAFLAYIVVSLPLSYFFGFTLGYGSVGIWMAYPISLTYVGWLYMHRFRKDIKLQVHSNGVKA